MTTFVLSLMILWSASMALDMFFKFLDTEVEMDDVNGHAELVEDIENDDVGGSSNTSIIFK